LKRFQPDLPEQRCIGWHQAADLGLGSICHGPNSMNRL
jgi:hypothetical protein